MKFDVIKDFYELFDQYEIFSVGEIGTHSGKTASQILNYLLSKDIPITYRGYDLFDEANESTNKEEVNGKGVGSYQRAVLKLQKLRKRYQEKFQYELIKGNTKDTLTPINFDFVYIDGGHSYDTVKHDYSMVKNSKIIVFDDYHLAGVKKFVDELLVENEGKFKVIHKEYATNPSFPRSQITLINIRT